MLVLDGEGSVAQLAFTPDGTRLVVMRARGYPYPATAWPAEVLTVATGERISFPHQPKALWPTLAVHPSGRLALFAEDAPLRVANLADGTAYDIGGEHLLGVQISPDGARAVATRAGDGSVFGFRLDTGERTTVLSDWTAAPRASGERVAGFIDDGLRFVTVGPRRIVIRNTDTGEWRYDVRYPAESAISPTLSADGTRLAVRSTSQFYLYDVEAWKIRYQLSTETRPFVRFTYHPTRPLLAVISLGQTLVKFMDADSGKITAKFNWKLGQMGAVCFSPDGTLCAAGAASGKVVVWDVD